MVGLEYSFNMLNLMNPILITHWWFDLFIIGLLFLPLTTVIFNIFFDKGYIFSKISGILLLSYTIWVLASLRILPFDTYSIFSLIGSFLILNIYIAKKTNFVDTFKKSWKIFLFEETLFLLSLIFWSFIRAHEPSIHGLEKYMDFGFINSILRSEYFPPKDLWLTLESINYYYFGHLIVAVLTKLSFLDPGVTFNLMVATLFGLTFTGAFSIGANLYQKISKKFIICGLLAAFLLTLTGNSHTIYLFFQNYNTDNPVPFWQLKPALNFSGYWYANATRFIPFTIHEFPLYSFVVADLHGHVLDIPLVLLTIAFIVIIYFQEKIHFGHIIFFGFLIASLVMTNFLDGPIYLLLFSIVTFYKFRLKAIQYIFPSSAFAILFSLPFWLNFKPFGSGVGLLCAPQFLTNLHFGPIIFEKDHCARSPLWMLIILFGFFYFVFFGFIKKVWNKFCETDNLILLLILFSTLLILIPEFFYVKDIYPAHFRANTVFKFEFQAFIVLSICAGYMIFRIFERFKLSILNIFYLGLFIVFCLLIFIYPIFAISSYYQNLKKYQGFDGLNYLQNLYPSDYLGISWLKREIIGQPVILEAVGESYTDYARVSANTGLPTVLGWPIHEWLWRGSPNEGTKREVDVKLIYESIDLEKTIELLKKYHVSYIFIGALERQKYPNLDENKFSSIGKKIFQEGQTIIYKLQLI